MIYHYALLAAWGGCIFKFFLFIQVLLKGCMPSFKLLLSLGLVKKFVVVVGGGGGGGVETNYSVKL